MDYGLTAKARFEVNYEFHDYNGKSLEQLVSQAQEVLSMYLMNESQQGNYIPTNKNPDPSIYYRIDVGYDVVTISFDLSK